MKDYLKYYYNLDIESIKEYYEGSIFIWNKKKYFFLLWNRETKELEEILSIIEKCLNNRINVMKPIKNNKNNYITIINDKQYILLENEVFNKEYDIIEMINQKRLLGVNQNSYKALDRSNWYQLWQEKLDYFEYQVHEMGKKYPLLMSLFSYYDALAENAISYVKQAQKIYVPTQKVISHKRVLYPNQSTSFDNPLNFIIDIEVRDIGEYIKHLALSNIDYALIDLKTYIETEKPNIYSLSMLYARLLYPSYYLDMHEKIVNKSEEEQKLTELIDTIPKYETFLKKAWLLINNYAPIEKIDWIIKKKL